jgi:hypothetical protein
MKYRGICKLECIFYLEYELLIKMRSKLADEQEKEEKKCGAPLGNTGRLKQLYDKTTTVTKKYDKVKNGYSSVNNAKNKVQNGCRWFESGEVHPTSATAAQQPPKQAAVNMVSQSVTVSQM